MIRSRRLGAKCAVQVSGHGSFHSGGFSLRQTVFRSQRLVPRLDGQETVVGTFVSEQDMSGSAPTFKLGRPTKLKCPLQIFSSEKKVRDPIDRSI